MICVFMETSSGHKSYSEGVRVSLLLCLDVAYWSVWVGQVFCLVMVLVLFLVMWYNLKRELLCPATLKCTEYYCDGCKGMRELLDSSFGKFLYFFVTFLAIFVTRFSIFTYILFSFPSSIPNEWPFIPVWVFYTTYFTEFVLIIQILIVRKN